MNKTILLVTGMLLLIAANPLMAQQGGRKAAPRAATQQAPTAPPELEQPEKVQLFSKPGFDSSAAPEDAHTVGIREMLRQMNAVDNANRIMDAMLVQQQDAATDPNAREFLRRFKEAYKTPRVTSMLENTLIKVYRKYYTPEEVQQLVAFYKTPIGQKSLAVMPQVMTESQQAGGQLGEMIAAEVLQQMNINQ